MARVIQHPTYPQYRKKLGVMPDFSGAKQIQQEVPMGVKDGTNTTFILYNTPIPNTEMVFKDGMFMLRGAGKDYTINGKAITFTEAPTEKTVIAVNYRTMDA